MSITTRSEYGLRALVVLAEQLPGELISASELSRTEEIPLKYLEQILAELKRAEIIRSQPGARGGYRLARPAREITVGEVVRILDGSQAPMGCTRPVDEAPRAQGNLRVLWQRLHRAITGVLDGTTLEQLTFRPTLQLEQAGEALPPAPTEPPAEGEGAPPADGVYQI